MKKKPKRETATCQLCGFRCAPTDEAMRFHILAMHPLDFLSHPKIMGRVAQSAFDLGAKFAEVFRVKNS